MAASSSTSSSTTKTSTFFRIFLSNVLTKRNIMVVTELEGRKKNFFFVVRGTSEKAIKEGGYNNDAMYIIK